MRLVDLEPRWWAMAGRHGQGVSFLCPHCVRGPKLFQCPTCRGQWRRNPEGTFSFLAGQPLKSCCDNRPASELVEVPITRLGVAFANPLDAGSPAPLGLEANLQRVHEHRMFDVPPGFLWKRNGDTFETLSLTPSVNCEASGHWHGFVALGEVTP